jgi:hypothetical protein
VASESLAERLEACCPDCHGSGGYQPTALDSDWQNCPNLLHALAGEVRELEQPVIHACGHVETLLHLRLYKGGKCARCVIDIQKRAEAAEGLLREAPKPVMLLKNLPPIESEIAHNREYYEWLTRVREALKETK